MCVKFWDSRHASLCFEPFSGLIRPRYPIIISRDAKLLSIEYESKSIKEVGAKDILFLEPFRLK